MSKFKNCKNLSLEYFNKNKTVTFLLWKKGNKGNWYLGAVL